MTEVELNWGDEQRYTQGAGDNGKRLISTPFLLPCGPKMQTSTWNHVRITEIRGNSRGYSPVRRQGQWAARSHFDTQFELLEIETPTMATVKLGVTRQPLHLNSRAKIKHSQWEPGILDSISASKGQEIFNNIYQGSETYLAQWWFSFGLGSHLPNLSPLAEKLPNWAKRVSTSWGL